MELVRAHLRNSWNNFGHFCLSPNTGCEEIRIRTKMPLAKISETSTPSKKQREIKTRKLFHFCFFWPESQDLKFPSGKWIPFSDSAANFIKFESISSQSCCFVALTSLWGPPASTGTESLDQNIHHRLTVTMDRNWRTPTLSRSLRQCEKIPPFFINSLIKMFH